jgi:hypothetical protein
MAASTSTVFPVTALGPEAASAVERSTRRRIDPASGRALEILGHAIEYLTDECVHEGGAAWLRDGRVEAVQLLMALNRQVYCACPEMPTLAERIRSLLHARVA